MRITIYQRAKLAAFWRTILAPIRALAYNGWDFAHIAAVGIASCLKKSKTLIR